MEPFEDFVEYQKVLACKGHKKLDKLNEDNFAESSSAVADDEDNFKRQIDWTNAMCSHTS